MTDPIPRAAAIEAINAAIDVDPCSCPHCRSGYTTAIERLRSIPAAQVAVKPFEWVEVTERRSDEDPHEEHTGGYEADCGFGSYVIDIGWGSDCYYWSVISPDQFDIGSDFDDPEAAKAAAQADYEARIRSALIDTPPATEVKTADQVYTLGASELSLPAVSDDVAAALVATVVKAYKLQCDIQSQWEAKAINPASNILSFVDLSDACKDASDELQNALAALAKLKGGVK